MRALLLLIVASLFMGSSPPGPALTSAEKKAIIEKVYKDIAMAMSLPDPPDIRLVRSKRFGAAVKFDASTRRAIVMVEELAFDLCMELGDRGQDALALIIGHEVAHYKLQHNWSNEFSSAFALHIAEEIDKAGDLMQNLKVFETQADDFGSRYAYLAGYDLSGLAGPVFDKIYAGYGFDDTQTKYPTKEERVSIAAKNDSLMQRLISTFELGNNLLVMGRFDMAIQCLEYSKNKGFQSREVYNNLGVAYALQAIDDLGDKVTLAYPLELDLKARIDDKSETRGFGMKPEELLAKAEEYFKIAVTLDDRFASGHVNLACVRLLLGEDHWRRARNSAEDALEIAEKQGDAHTIRNAKVVLGNYSFLKGDTDEATELWTEAKEGGDVMAEINLKVATGAPLSSLSKSMSTTGMSFGASAERIGSLSLRAIFDDIQFDTFYITQGMLLYTYAEDDFKVMAFEDAVGDYMVIQQTASTYKGQSAKGIKIGSTAADVRSQYGEPKAVQASRQGQLLIYQKPPMIARIDINGQVAEWWLYQTFN